MPTKLKRVTVNVPDELYSMIHKDALFNRRPEANQVLWILDQWYAERKREMEFFKPSQQREAKRPDVPVFETPTLLQTERVSKLRAQLDREKS